MDEKQQSQPNSPFEISSGLNPQSTGPTTQQPQTQTQPNQSQEKPKTSLHDLLRRGINQFSPMPKEQKFTPPPETAAVPNTPLPTQPKIESQVEVEKKPNLFSPLKILILFALLLIIAVITAAATLVATEYQIYSPPEAIRNFLESIFGDVSL